jgi:hypothetical protein
MRIPFSGIASLIGLAALSFTLSTPAYAEASGDGRMGPRIVTGDAFDQTLFALNDFIQSRYVQDDMLAALASPPSPDFVSTAVATASAPEMPYTIEPSAFGPSVNDDPSLNNSMDLLNTAMLERGTDLFLKVAEEASHRNLDFAEIAQSVDVDNALDRAEARLAADPSGFGDRVSDGRTLNDQVAAVNRHIQEFAERETLLGLAVPGVTGKSFDSFALAMLISY